MIEIKVSFDHHAEYPRKACEPWAALAPTPAEKSGIEDLIEMEKAADAALDRAHTRFIVSNDPDAIVDGIAPYVDRHGFTRLVFHFPGIDQRRQVGAFCNNVLPLLIDRWGAS